MTLKASTKADDSGFKQAATSQSPLSQSRETGDVLPEVNKDGRSVASTAAPTQKPWAHFVAGGTGGMTAAFLTSPLDVLKTRLQSDFYQSQLTAARHARGVPPLSQLSLAQTARLHVRETFQILFAIPKVEGWKALFKGLGPNLVGVVPARAINFWAYGNGKRLISQNFNDGQEAAWVHLLAAANAGIVTGTATNPIWLVKTRLQLDKATAEKTGAGLDGRKYKNALDCTLQTVRTEGIRGLYRGLTASYLGVTESTLQWVLYEQMKGSLARREARLAASGRQLTSWDDAMSWVGKLGAAGGAKFIAALATYPHEVARTRLRQAPVTTDSAGRPQLKYTGLVQCFKLIWREEGMAALYGGLTPHMLRVVPSAAIMFGMYEFVLRVLGTTSGV
ncbi:mitochondrial carrier protein-like protein rim2 [Elsinoe ampelina]|uniref:Mitochondrial carrier protein-like protein rim2 n=1 Tax=Elsinoe ampelina TaxID=302913 RepID=A0A6A6G3Z0_9PEZI|nr:mitochondrial carrier protein-like protein rim2 [Elsinoe ampelina]